MPRDMPAHERPISERIRLACKDWANKRRKFRGYDKFEKVTFDEMVVEVRRQAIKRGERITKTDAETEVRTSETWKKFLTEMLDAEHAMNIAESEKDAVEAERWERNDANATAREERRSYRMGG